MVKIAAVIVTYNRLSALQYTLAQTLAQPFSRIFIVNNASDDGTREWLDNILDNRVQCVHLPENRGGSGGFACGFALALDSDADWVLCYDDDAHPQSNALTQFLQQPLETFDAAAAAVYYEDGVICEMNRPSWNPFWHKAKLPGVAFGVLGVGDSRTAFHVSNEMYQHGVRYIDSCSFVGFFIRREWLEKIPLPDPGLFIYGDDILYTLTLTRSGGRIAFLPEVRFVHRCATIERGQKLYRPIWKNYFHFRNLMLIYRLAAGKWFHIVWPIKYVQWRFYARRLSAGERSVYLRLLRRGVRDGLRRDLSATLEQVKALANMLSS